MTDSMREDKRGKSVGGPVSDAEDNLLRQVKHWSERALAAEARVADLLADVNSLRAEMQQHVDLRYQAEAVAQAAKAKAHRMDQHIQKLCAMIEAAAELQP